MGRHRRGSVQAHGAMSNADPPGTPDTSTIGGLLAAACAQLAPAHSTARLDSEVLLAHVLGCPRSRLWAYPERRPARGQTARFRALVARRLTGEPVAYLTGTREFWSLPLRVTPDTLIPRPETEDLVELALERIPADTPTLVADLGTGTGAIALAIARERPRARLVATERDAAVLAVARANGLHLGIANIEYRTGDWCAALSPGARYRLVVSNPPYIPTGDPHLAQGDVAFEPCTALAAGPDGLDAIRRIAAQARDFLEPGGGLLLEHGYDQGDAVCRLLATLGYQDVEDHWDAAGQPRVTVAIWVPATGPRET